MQLPRYQVSTLHPAAINSVRFSVDGRHFAVASETGYEVWRTYPLALVRRRALPGELALALLLPGSPLLVLQGGGKNPLYPPNKAVIYNDKLGVPVAELEFGERIRGVVVRRGTICIALTRRVVAFEYAMGSAASASAFNDESMFTPGISGAAGLTLSKLGEWQTFLNEDGLAAISTSPGSSVLVLPGRSPGHVQLVSLPPCPGPPSHSLPPSKSSAARPGTFRSPIILAHTHPLSNLACTPDGSKILTTSERGTLLRVWDTARGSLERELRRGVDRAEIWGAEFEPGYVRGKEDSGSAKVVGWSDKGTVHVWSGADEPKPPSGTPSLAHLLSKNLPLPKYFSSTASSAQYRLPRKNPHAFAAVVGAAAGKAGVPSAKLSEEDDWAERFIVNWVQVAVPSSATTHPSHAPIKEKENAAPGVPLSSARSSTSGRKRSIGMGKREERSSFGSDATSRTATPTLRARSETPTLASRPGHAVRQSSLSSNKPGLARAPSVLVGKERDRAGSVVSRADRRSTVASTPGDGTISMEWQLVAITYSGDWYRLRIPTPTTDDDTPIKKKGQCELVEYRRLRVGGGGW